MTTTTAPTAAETVAATLTAHPDGITTRDLATASGVSASATAKALAAMEADGIATRTPGPANGNRKTADMWHPADTTAPANEVPADVTPADTVPADEIPADVTPADVSPADIVPADEVPADVTPADTSAGEGGVAAVAPVSGAPVGPRQPDLKVLIMAGVLGGHPHGVTADEAIDESGLSVAMGDTILAAMEVAGAARRLPIADNAGTELWVMGDGDLASVDPANAPTHVTCPTCGHERKIRRPSARRAAATGSAGARTGCGTGEVNSDGSAKLAKGELERMVEAFMRDLGPGHDVTAGVVGRELGRSPGACRNALARLTDNRVLTLVSVAPEVFALPENAPDPSPAVLALMTRPQTAEDATDADADGPAEADADTTGPADDTAITTGDDAADDDTAPIAA